MNGRSIKFLSLLLLAAVAGALSMMTMPANFANAQDSRGSGAMHKDMQAGGMKSDAMKTGAATGAATHDTRQAIAVNKEELAFVLAEMRGFLESVQGIVEGVTMSDMKAVAAAGRKNGMSAMAHAPPTLMKKLPKGFRMLGVGTHKKFDGLAAEANQMGDKAQVLKQLSGLLRNCTACHATYRFTAK